MVLFAALFGSACTTSSGSGSRRGDTVGTGGTGGTGATGAVFDPDAVVPGTDAPSTGTGTGGASDAGGTTGQVLPDVGSSLTCKGDGDCPAIAPHCTPDGFCVQCMNGTQCQNGQICYQSKCLFCQPGKKQCSGNDVVECKADASGFDVIATCTGGQVCGGGGCFACIPGKKQCQEGKAMICKNDGSAWDLSQDCVQSGIPCNEALGLCLSPCSKDIKLNTNAGCGFYAVDLDNAKDTGPGGEVADAWSAQFAVITSNTDASKTAKVTVTLPDGTTQVQDVAPLSLAVFKLPPKFGQEGTSRNKNAYAITSTLPITAYQFNPLSNEKVFSNDASVLLPEIGLGKEYYVVAGAQIANKFRSYVTIIGLQEESVDVTVTVSAPTLAGSDIPALAAGQSATLKLARGEVLNIESNADGADMTGTHVQATGPVQVFGGSEASVTAEACCADHLEEQLIPVEAWGKEYVVTRSKPRGVEKDYVRVIASNDGTQVQVNPNPGGPGLYTLKAGQWIEFKTGTHCVVTANQPVMVAQYLASSGEIEGNVASFCTTDAECPQGWSCLPFSGCIPPMCTQPSQCPEGHNCVSGYCEAIGDPDLILVAPKEQWRQSYVFLTPDSYQHDYVNITAPKGATVTLDGKVLGQGDFAPVQGTSEYVVHVTELSDGVHTVSSDSEQMPIAIIVYGYDDDVSYGYVGGLGLQTLKK